MENPGPEGFEVLTSGFREVVSAAWVEVTERNGRRFKNHT